MAQYYYKFPKAQAEIDVNYNFMCEHCNHSNSAKVVVNSDKIDTSTEKSNETTVQISFMQGGRISAESVEKLKDAATKSLDGKIRQMKNNFGEGIYTNDLNGRCSSCGKHQSWESKNAYSHIVIDAIAGLVLPLIIVGFGFFIAWLSGNIALFERIVFSLMSLIIFGICAFIGASIGFVKMLRIKSDAKSVVVQNKPDISWPDIAEARYGYEDISFS